MERSPMDSFLRKQKPRLVKSAKNPPPSLSKAPAASVRDEDRFRTVRKATRPEDDTSRSSIATTATPTLRNAPLSQSPPSAAKPRKRFRKKVSGLFGDETELKRRMSKLLIAPDAIQSAFLSAEVDSKASPHLDKSGVEEPPTLSGAEKIVARLEEVIQRKDSFTCDQDDFDTLEFTAKATRVLGSREKLEAVRKTMGSLNPQSNERFLAELDLITLPMGNHEAKQEQPITPPDLPSLESSDLDSELEWGASPVSVERTAAPAVLRRKARRLDRGYRATEVLRARLGKPKKGRKRVSPYEMNLNRTRGRVQANKRKERVARLLENEKENSDTDEEMVSPQRTPPRRRSAILSAQDPFQMLVEVAAVEQENSVVAHERAEEDARRDTDVGEISRERRTKRRRMRL